MKVTKIKIKNLFGISEYEADGTSVELIGRNGSGKTSVLDAIKYALTNRSERDYIIKNGSHEGEIFIETDTGLSINRKPREGKAPYKSIKQGKTEIPAPESFLNEIFTPLQLNPVDFIQMNAKEQNRLILDLIDFKWDLNWIARQFGELPDVNYEQNILQVLNDIQAENSPYYMRRQNLNREKRLKDDHIKEISADIPNNYQPEKWKNYSLSDIYSKIEAAKEHNNKIENAISLKRSFDNEVRGLEAQKEIELSAMNKKADEYKSQLETEIARLEEQIKSSKEKLSKIEEQKEQRTKAIDAEFQVQKASVNAELEANKKYLDMEKQDFSELQKEAETAEKMKSHLNEYERMKSYQFEVDGLIQMSEELTEKIELARTLPGEILKKSNIPVEGLSISDEGIPLINGLPVSNLSEGEKLDLCMNIAISNPSSLQILLIDGVEKLDQNHRDKLYEKCKEKGLQLIATRTTDDEDLTIIQLEESVNLEYSVA